MNCKNANRELGFDNFANCDYNLHWSFSNFNRMLMAAGHVARLPINSVVLELGAGTSELENYVKKNFKRDDIVFVKVDGDKLYESSDNIEVMDITDECEWLEILGKVREKVDAAVFMEVIEHITVGECVDFVLSMIVKWLKPEGLLLLTTPTPPENKRYENEVWPDDHKNEFTYQELYDIINTEFKVIKELGWSLEEREYNRLLENDKDLMRIYAKLRGAMPESYIKATIACLAPVKMNRQIFMVCKKRRIGNGRKGARQW